METISAHPSASTLSATSGEFIRLEVMIGMETSPINFLVTHANAARGTLSQGRMFTNTEDFNQDISNWDVSSGTNFVSALELL